MSNRIGLWSTTFKDPSGESYGFRVADDGDKAYYNFLEAPVNDDMEILKIAANTDEFSQFADFIVETHSGLSINDNWYSWEEIKEIFE